MLVTATTPITNTPLSQDVAAESIDDIKDLLAFDLSPDALKKKLDRLDISADAKSILFTIAKTSIRVGTVVVQLGRKVLDLVIGLLSEFPNATKGAIIGGLFGVLVSAVPLIGLVLGPLLTPLAVALGFLNGVWEDIGDKAMARRIASEVKRFDGLKS